MDGGCSSKEQGDLIATRTDANFSTTLNPPPRPTSQNPNPNPWASCTGGSTITNVNYSADGYFYAVEFPQAISGTVSVQLYDPANCP